MTQSLTDLRHARSKKDFPFLTLEEGEYVELAITRAKIGLLVIWFAEIVGFLALTLILVLFDNGMLSSNALGAVANNSATNMLRMIIFILFGVLILTGLIGTKVYLDNKMFITNKRVIQISSNALFHKSTNIIELSRIEDVSFKKEGVFEYLFHLGTIRMSTVGDETTYTFHFVETPTDEIQTITHLVYQCKNKE